MRVVGFAIEDFSALRWLRDCAAQVDIPESLDLIAEPDDQRELFGMPNRCAARAQLAEGWHNRAT